MTGLDSSRNPREDSRSKSQIPETLGDFHSLIDTVELAPKGDDFFRVKKFFIDDRLGFFSNRRPLS
jgi:hypothetical protein